MRVSTADFYRQSIAAIQRQQAQSLATQNQLATGQRMVSASDDPTAAAQALSLDQALGSTQRYADNAQRAGERLGLEENALASVNDAINSVREKLVQAGNAALSDADRKTLAVDVRAALAQIVSAANSVDGQGRYLFAGGNDGAAPFSFSAGGVQYHGDAIAHSMEIGPGRQLATADAGSAVFLRMGSGNGQFSVAASAANTGTVRVAAASLASPAAYDAEPYTLQFSAGRYTVSDADGNTVQSADYQAGQSIRFRGLDLRLDGEPADGDRITVSPSRQQDVFATVTQLAEWLETPQQGDAAKRAQAQTAMFEGLSALSVAQNHILDTRARLGGRLQVAEAASLQQQTRAIGLESSLSALRDVDYAEATGRLSQQLVGLQAAQQSFLKIQGLSLFNYLR